jgi:hypothetical protein
VPRPPLLNPHAVTSVDGYVLEPAGHTWDAIRVPAAVGHAALQILGDRSGAVLTDPRSMVYYWFVAPGTAAAWALTDTVPMGPTHTIVVPVGNRTTGPGPHWRVCPAPGDKRRTDAAALRAALEDALGRTPRL